MTPSSDDTPSASLETVGLRGLRDRPVLITGAADGIGRATALRLGREGSVVAILDLDGAGAERTAAEIREKGGRAFAYEADIRDAGAVEEAVAGFCSAAGSIGGLVNNAGWDRAADFLDTDPELWRKIVDINLHGPAERDAGRALAHGGGGIGAHRQHCLGRGAGGLLG